MKWLPFQHLPFDQSSKSALPSSMAGMLAKRRQEVRRLARQHVELKREMRGNFLAPVTAPVAILDVGCENGRWVMEVAAQFPAARVIGIDSTLPEPFLSLGNGIDQKPPNAEFLQANTLERLPFPDTMFDFVHLRFIYTVVPAQAWEPLMGELIRVTRPGGWIESVEPLPYAVQQKEGLTTIIGWFGEWLRNKGIEPLAALKMPTLMKSAGLEQVASCQVGQNAGSLQDEEEMTLRRNNGSLLVDLLRDPLVTAGIVVAEEYDRVAAIARAEIQYNPSLNCFNTYVNVGRRPMAP
jgi:ubiquinone/menaquinone biosynthesis C-methylase UbiE